MSVTLSYTVLQIIKMALGKIGVSGDQIDNTPQIAEDAFRNFNMILGAMSADPDLAVNRIVPVGGYTNFSDVIALPPEYIAYLVPELANNQTSDFDQKADKMLLDQAEIALANLKLFNVRRISGSIPNNNGINK